MARVELDEREWQQVIAVLATAPWNVANPLLMKIGEQLRNQTADGVRYNPPGEMADLNRTNKPS